MICGELSAGSSDYELLFTNIKWTFAAFSVVFMEA